MEHFLVLVCTIVRDDLIGKTVDWVLGWFSKRFPRNKESNKYERCRSYEDLFTTAISDVANVTNTDYNQIILCVNGNSHGLHLLVCADKIADGKQKYRIVANSGLIATCYHTGKHISMVNNKKDSRYFPAVNETKSELVVPIQWNGNKIGVINSEAVEKYYYSNRMLAELQEIAKSICLRLSEMQFWGDSREMPYVSL